MQLWQWRFGGGNWNARNGSHLAVDVRSYVMWNIVRR